MLRDVIVGGQPHIVQLVGFAEAGMPWSIVVSVPEETVFGWVYRLRDRIIWVSVAASVVATLVLLLFWRRSIERPMAAISSRLAIIGAGGYSGDPRCGGKGNAPDRCGGDRRGRLINERQSARLELIARLRDLVEAMEQAPVGIAILEADRRLGFANRAARIALSVDEGEDESIDAAVLGMTEAEFAAKAELVLNGRTVRGEAALPGPAGVTSQYGVVLSPLSDGAPYGFSWCWKTSPRPTIWRLG